MKRLGGHCQVVRETLTSAGAAFVVGPVEVLQLKWLELRRHQHYKMLTTLGRIWILAMPAAHLILVKVLTGLAWRARGTGTGILFALVLQWFYTKNHSRNRRGLTRAVGQQVRALKIAAFQSRGVVGSWCGFL
jgi:hypothetical protein